MITLKAGFKQCNTYTCILYLLNEIDNVILVLYVDYTLAIGDKPAFMNTI